MELTYRAQQLLSMARNYGHKRGGVKKCVPEDLWFVFCLYINVNMGLFSFILRDFKLAKLPKDRDLGPGGKFLPYDVGMKKVLREAKAEAKKTDSPRINTGHLLLGLYRVSKPEYVRRVSLRALRSHIKRQVNSGGEQHDADPDFRAFLDGSF